MMTPPEMCPNKTGNPECHKGAPCVMQDPSLAGSFVVPSADPPHSCCHQQDCLHQLRPVSHELCVFTLVLELKAVETVLSPFSPVWSIMLGSNLLEEPDDDWTKPDPYSSLMKKHLQRPMPQSPQTSLPQRILFSITLNKRLSQSLITGCVLFSGHSFWRWSS